MPSSRINRSNDVRSIISAAAARLRLPVAGERLEDEPPLE
jgi:hypothetical protein